MGVMEPEGGSINGRILTGAAAIKSTTLSEEQRKKKERQTIQAIALLRRTLQAIDQQISILNQDIKKLENDLINTEQESQEAFDRMHELENILNEIDTHGFTQPYRIRLYNTIGPDSDKAQDDKALRAMAEKRSDQERESGIAAFERTEKIRNQIHLKKAARDNLEKSKRSISDSDLSTEEKANQLQESLNHFLATDLNSIELSRELEINEEVKAHFDSELVTETVDSDFEFEEDQEITITAKPNIPEFG